MKEEKDEFVAEAIALPVDRVTAYGAALPVTGDDHPQKNIINEALMKHSFPLMAGERGQRIEDGLVAPTYSINYHRICHNNVKKKGFTDS